MDFKKLIQAIYYLQISFFVSGLYLLLIYIFTNNKERIPIMTGVLCINFIALKLTRDRFKY
ncbi:hypothetical protein WD019_17745 [Fictibacillus sp. Mic-4]|uniref:hypothetical protein n=1 Tax=Fictibacillus TaxID=1329200 RepID=UPI0004235883|nr:hypothetical protein [Fictibacillus gelatini]